MLGGKRGKENKKNEIRGKYRERDGTVGRTAVNFLEGEGMQFEMAIF